MSNGDRSYDGQRYAPEHCPTNSPLLVALAQNGALRLRCDRANISLVDESSLSMVVEATRSTWLFENQDHGLFREHGTISRSMAVFNHGSDDESINTYDMVANATRLVVRDMRCLDQYKGCSHVIGPPHVVSFAEVPIRNSSGHLVGTYCVMDNRVRHDFFADETFRVLTDMARLISSYLDLHTSAAASSCLGPFHAEQPLGPAHFEDSSQSNLSLFTPQSEADDFGFPSIATDRPSAPDPALNTIKSDFVSSISHELRSPLHGCLAAVELLQDTKVDDTQAELIDMIQACALTLLDTLNHLLDFTMVNDFRSPESRARKDRNDNPLSHSQNMFGSSKNQYLCTILQDVVEGVHFGQSSQQAAYSKAKTTPINKLAFSTHPAILLDSSSDEEIFLATNVAGTVAVYLDVQNHADWCTTLPVGAWKRLVMNLFGNALKFTTEGFVEVSMKLVRDEELEPTMRLHGDKEQGDKGKHFVRLMINDTGIGMSEDYMKLHLYQPFAQQNQLVSGVGLGLSIVKQIVDDLGGTISVESKQGVGTMFDILVPLCEQDAQCSSKIPSGGEILDPDAALKGLTVCLLPPSRSQAPRTDLHSRRISVMHSYVRSIAEGWFAMNIVTASTTAQVEADIYIAEALHYIEDDTDRLNSSRHPTILVGPRPAGNNELQHNMINLAYPLGPKSLGRAFFAALENPVEPGHPHEAIDLEPLPRNMKGLSLEQHPDSTPTRMQSIQATDTTKSEHVLLVDDNAINLKLLAAYVKKLGYNVELAVDGKDAYQKYQAAAHSKPFTTILMDISMPIMNGFESTRAIRQHEAMHSILPPARIIALTGLGSDSSRKEAELSGMNEFRTKPVALKTLKALLSS